MLKIDALSPPLNSNINNEVAKMNKVGIVTYYRNYNYGSVLQAYALQQFLIENGYDAEIVDYMDYKKKYNIQIKRKTYINKLTTMLQHPSSILKTLKRKYRSSESINERSQKSIKTFDDFVLTELRLSNDNYLDDYYRAVICGSDQVWRADTPGLDELFFLRPFDEKKRIAYAPSIGIGEIPDYNKRRFVKYVREIPYLSVREIKAKELVEREVGVHADLVVDPVLLPGANFWLDRTRESLIKGKYMLCYFLDYAEETISEIEAYGEKTSARIVWVDSGDKYIDSKYNTISPSPIDFVNLIRYADRVFTDSFHAVAFCIMLNTRFVVFDRNYRLQSNQQTRIDSILNLSQLQGARNKGGITFTDYNFEKANRNIEIYRRQSISFIENALKSVVGG